MKKVLCWLMVTMLLAASAASQTRRGKKVRAKKKAAAVKSEKDGVVPMYTAEPPPLAPPAPPPLPSRLLPENYPAKRRSSNVFRDVAVGEWGVSGLSIPKDLTAEYKSSDVTTNKNVSWTTYARSWRQPGGYHPAALEVSLTVTTWNNDWTEVIPDLRPDLATPENLLRIDVAAEVKNKNKPDSPVKDAKLLELDGVEGGYFRAEMPGDARRFMLGWFTYRYYQGKPQRVSLTVTGGKDELEQAEKIVQTLKL